MHYLATKNKNKYAVKTASMMKCEFGLQRSQYNKFKGDFLVKIRTKELFNAEIIQEKRF